MKRRVVSAASRELVDAFAWYEAKSLSAAANFEADYSRALSNIGVNPHSYPKAECVPPSERDIRQCLLKRFPYVIYFEISEEELTILAISHASREPRYWLEGRT